jgi:hypothetical protein
MDRSSACGVCFSLIELADKTLINGADTQSIVTTVQEAADKIETEAKRMLDLARQLKDAAEFLKMNQENDY